MKKNILIFEPNPYHQEILPGFIKYFIDLDYNVTLFTRTALEDSKVFSKFNHNFKTIVYDYEKKDEELSKLNLADFDFIFFSSIERYENQVLYKSLDDIKTPLKTKFGIIGCYHTTSHVEKQNTWNLYNEGRIFSLNEFEYENKPTKMLAPIYFGDVNKNHDKNKKTRFILIGSFWKYKFRYRWIFNIIDELKKRKYKNFEIVMIGEGTYNYYDKKRWYRHLTPIRYNKYLKILGELPFDKMFKEVEKSDFLCPMLDEECEKHKHYLKETTSGARNLCYGFNIPPVINEKFANAYSFNNDNAITYKLDDIVEAMIKAIDMKNDEYQNIKNNLEKTSNIIYNKSISNLKETIHTIAKQ